jgi:hypothetical protein
MSLLTEASLVITPNAVEEGKLFSIIPTDGSGDLTVVRATTATRVNSAGLIESVANNVPRLDYTNSSCPSILVEPQRTNLVLRSEEFDNLTVWPGSAGVTRLANQGIAPNGTNTMDLITFPISGNSISQSVTVINGTTYTFSVWLASQSGTQTVEIGNINSGIYQSVTVTTTPQRFEVTQVASSTNRFPAIRATAAYSIFAWGAQLEAGSNATSYIPTVASTVTRNADVISKTGIADLIGQTEGTMFLDINLKVGLNIGFIAQLSDGTQNNRVQISLDNISNNTIYYQMNGNGNLGMYGQINFTDNQRLKIAISYKSGDSVFYLNGVKINSISENSVNTPISLDRINFGASHSITSSIFSKYNSVQLYKTRLTNSELAQLTTI